MRIKHYFVLSSFFYSVQIVVDSRLAVVVLAYRKYVAHITTLHRVIAVFVHQLISGFHMALVVACRT